MPSKPGADRPAVPLRLRLLLGFNRMLMHTWHRVEVSGRPEVPTTGPAILAPNHTAALDPLAIQSALARPVRWMMAAEYRVRPLGPVFDIAGVIPVNRDGRDSTATRAALRALAAGDLLGIFPEGRIETTNDLLPLQPGVAHLAARTGAPVIPIYLTGSQRGHTVAGSIVRPQEVFVRFGRPIVSREVSELMSELDRSLRALRADAEGGKKISRPFDKGGNV